MWLHSQKGGIQLRAQHYNHHYHAINATAYVKRAWLIASQTFAKTNRHFDEETTMTAEETVAFSLWDVYLLGPECSPAFILQQHFLFPGEPLLPTQVWESPPVAGWTAFNLSVFLISSAKVRAAWENIPNPHVPLSESPPPRHIFIYMARVAAGRISIFRLRVSFQTTFPTP